MVTARRREVGVRIALGADRGRVLAGVMTHGASRLDPNVVLRED
jgi:hypothetical protein